MKEKGREQRGVTLNSNKGLWIQPQHEAQCFNKRKDQFRIRKEKMTT